MSLTRKVAYNTIAQGIGKILTLACSLAIVILITRHLGVAGYGNYNIIITYLGFFAVIADLGLTMIMVREISQNPEDKEKTIGNVLGLRIFTAILALILASAIAFFLNYPQVVKTGILIFSVGIFFMLMCQVLVGIFQVELRVDKSSFAELIGKILTLVLIIWFIHQGYSLLLIMTAASAGFALNFFIDLVFVIKYSRIWPRMNFDLWKKIFWMALPLGIVGILTTIYYKIDTVLLSLLPLKHVLIPAISNFSNSEAVGIYGASYRVLDIVLVLPSIFVGLIYPVLSFHINSDKVQTQKVFQKSFNFLIISGALIATISFFLAPQIIDIVGGKAFSDSISILKILSIAFLPFFASGLTTAVLTATNKQKVLIIPFVFFALINIVANIIFIPRYSFYGAAWVTTIGHFAVCFITYYLVFRHTKLLPSLLILIKVIISGLITGGLIFWVQKNNLLLDWQNFVNLSILSEIGIILIIILAVMLIYFVILYLLKAINIDDIKSLTRNNP